MSGGRLLPLFARLVPKRRMPPWSLAVHGGALVLLAGAILTSTRASQGYLPLTEGCSAASYLVEADEGAGWRERPLGFAVRLVDFRIVPYGPVESGNGPARVKEYESEIEILEDGRAAARRVISVNRPLDRHGFRLSQSGFDPRDPRRSVLGVSCDPGRFPALLGMALVTLGLAWRCYLRPPNGRRTDEGRETNMQHATWNGASLSPTNGKPQNIEYRNQNSEGRGVAGSCHFDIRHSIFCGSAVGSWFSRLLAWLKKAPFGVARCVLEEASHRRL